MRLVGLADGRPCDGAGEFVAAVGTPANGWRIVTTPDAERAQRWPSHPAAWLAWVAVDGARPVRSDGKPNRPNTAYTVAIEAVP